MVFMDKTKQERKDYRILSDEKKKKNDNLTSRGITDEKYVITKYMSLVKLKIKQESEG